MEDAIRLYYRGEIFEAEKILKSILQEEPENINALIRLAAVHQDLGRSGEAGAVYLKVAEIYDRGGDHEECLEFLEKASPVVPEARLSAWKGKCLFRLGNYTEALSHLVVSPQNSENLFYTGKAYFALNQYNNALRVFREILTGAADTEEAFRACYWIGKSLYATGELEEAISCFNSYISVYPNETQVYLDLAICLLNAGRPEEARSNLVQYRHLGGSEEVVTFYLGIVHYHLGQYREAVDLLERTSASGQALHWKGLALYELGSYEEALESFTAATRHEARALYYKMAGNAHLKLGSFFEAKICYEKALSIDSSDENLEKLIALSVHLLKSKGPKK